MIKPGNTDKGFYNEGFFRVLKQDASSNARTGVMELPHGRAATPAFMPVGTNGTVKALTNEDLYEIGFEIILSNTYHLYLRPGMDVIGASGGLHRFMNWNRNILTDSGGFQIFSLSGLRKIHEDGVKFKSHIDGSTHFLSPEDIVNIQRVIGSDIQMQLDVCTPWNIKRREAEKALEITALWLARAKAAWEGALREGYTGSLFAIVQGNFFKDLRERSAELVIESGAPGIAIGGLSVGEPYPVFQEFLAYTSSLLPLEKPKYVMGIGTPEYILDAIGEGIDMFDCVFPTRAGRNGHVFTRRGGFALKKAENALAMGPIDEDCTCKVCRQYSRAYLRHLFKTQEILCSMLASYHNLYFLRRLIVEAGEAIENDNFASFRRDFLSRYKEGVI